MTNRSKLAAIAMLTMVGIATPAFAGSFNDDQTTAAKLDEASLRQASPNGLTVVPLLVAYSDSSSATGGGSDGYNDSTAHDYI
jgi:hypothetical protein